MKKLLFLVLLAGAFSSHDLFLKLDNYILPPNSSVTLSLFNGSFATSENVITRDRMLDVSVVSGGNRVRIDTTQWREADHTTLLDLETGAAGTYLVGVSTRARNIDLTAEKFNDYLEHDGILDILAARKAAGTLNKDATERYAKHVKTLFQVGTETTDDHKTPLGYPIEFVPLDNPYASHAGHELRVQLLWHGEPLPGQLVYLGREEAKHDQEHGHDHAAGHDHQHGTVQLRTDDRGIVTIRPDAGGTWYLRTIYMTESETEGLTHESNWATLTFALPGSDHSHAHTHADETAHDHAAEAHDHTHDHEGGLPGYVWWFGSLLVIGALFFYFNRNRT